jgi:hypothetical protein
MLDRSRSLEFARATYVPRAEQFFFFLGLLPKLGHLVAAIPQPVIGGAGLVMFGMVAANGIRILSTVDFRARPNDLFVVAVSVAASGPVPTLSRRSSIIFLPGFTRSPIPASADRCRKA